MILKPAIGTLEWKNGKKWFNGVITALEEQHGDDLFLRYQTDISIDMEPLVKYNRDTKRVYFLTERSFNGEISFPEYSTKGYIAKVTLTGLR